MGNKAKLPSNETLAQFLANKAKIKTLEKANEAIKSQIEAAGGTFTTDEFQVETTVSETNRSCDAETLLLKVGFVECNNLGLIVKGERKNLKVERIEKAAA